MVTLGAQWLTMYTYISAHLDHLRARGLSDETLTDRRHILERLCRAVGDLHTATTQQVEAWIASNGGDPSRGWTRQTKATYYTHIRGYYRWAVRQKLVPANPTDLLDRPRVPYQAPRSVSEADFRYIIDNAVEPYLTAALLGGYAGLRCAEICRARREDLDAESIRVLGKGGRVDEIPTHEEIWKHVRHRRGLLVRDAHGRQYRPATMSSMWAGYVRHQLGVDMHLHQTRHLYANDLRLVRLPDGSALDMEVIRTLTRHQSLDTLQRYLCARETERRIAIQALRSHANLSQGNA